VLSIPPSDAVLRRRIRAYNEKYTAEQTGPANGRRRPSLTRDVGQRKMDEARVKYLVEELDRAVPKEGAVISFRQYGGGPDESKIMASKVGLLRAGVELLRAGIGPARERKEEKALGGLRAITHSESEFQFDYFEETLLPEDRALELKKERTAKLIGIGLTCIVVLTIGFALYGVARLFY